MFLFLCLSAGFWVTGINAQACNDSSQCVIPELPHCHLDIMLCVECLSDTHCSEPEPFCVESAGFCVGCGNMSALCASPTPVCDMTGRCIECDGEMTTECRENEFCRDNLCACANGDRCRGDNEMCAVDNGCGCAPGFIFNDDLGECTCAPTPCPEPEPDDCKECESDSDCKNKGEECRDDKCVCPHGLKLFRGCCTKPGRLGGNCLNGRCRGRNVHCNRSTNMCMCKRGCGEPAAVCLRRKGPWG